jgi:hypothetical protein
MRHQATTHVQFHRTIGERWLIPHQDDRDSFAANPIIISHQAGLIPREAVDRDLLLRGQPDLADDS